jgi:hypothetical protein
VASWQFTCVGHGRGRKYGSIVDIVILINPCFKQSNMGTLLTSYANSMWCIKMKMLIFNIIFFDLKYYWCVWFVKKKDKEQESSGCTVFDLKGVCETWQLGAMNWTKTNWVCENFLSQIQVV